MSVIKYVGEEALQELVTKMKNYTDNKEVVLDNTVTQNSSNGVKSSGIYSALTEKQNNITSSNKLNADLVDDTSATHKFVTASEKTTWSAKQNALTFDSAPTSGSDNPVKSGGIYTALSGKQDTLTFDITPTDASTNPVTSGGVYATTNGLATRLTTIEGKIPSAATSSNQLADKEFVNSSIATATATFKGSYDIVYDLELSISQADFHSTVATALGTKVSGEDDNDYAYVLIPASQATGTFEGNGTFNGIGNYGDIYNITITIANGAISSISATNYTTGASSDFLGSPSDWSGSNGSYSSPSGQGEYMHLTWQTATKTYLLDDDNSPFATLHRPFRQIDRYKYNGTAWVYEYTLNNSGFTAAQWSAINSGITPSLVTQIGTNQSNISTINTTLTGKEDTSNKVTSLSSNSTDTQYPSAKLVYTQLSLKQDSMTAITTAEVDALF